MTHTGPHSLFFIEFFPTIYENYLGLWEPFLLDQVVYEYLDSDEAQFFALMHMISGLFNFINFFLQGRVTHIFYS